MSSFEGRTGHARAEPFSDGHLIYWILEEHPDYDENTEARIEYSPTLALLEFHGSDAKDPVPLNELLTGLRDYVRYEVVGPFARLCFDAELDLPDPVF